MSPLRFPRTAKMQKFAMTRFLTTMSGKPDIVVNLYLLSKIFSI